MTTKKQITGENDMRTRVIVISIAIIIVSFIICSCGANNDKPDVVPTETESEQNGVEGQASEENTINEDTKYMDSQETETQADEPENDEQESINVSAESKEKYDEMLSILDKYKDAVENDKHRELSYLADEPKEWSDAVYIAGVYEEAYRYDINKFLDEGVEYDDELWETRKEVLWSQMDTLQTSYVVPCSEEFLANPEYRYDERWHDYLMNDKPKPSGY